MLMKGYSTLGHMPEETMFLILIHDKLFYTNKPLIKKKKSTFIQVLHSKSLAGLKDISISLTWFSYRLVDMLASTLRRDKHTNFMLMVGIFS